jgi:hypothetical protein
MDAQSTPDIRQTAWRRGIRWFLCHPRLAIMLALVAAALTAPSLRVGWQFDDDFHRITIRGSHKSPDFSGSIWDMFRFVDGDSARTLRMMDYGVLPWWTLPEVKGSFWRPLSIMSHWVDYHFWPNTPELMHAQSILWYALLVIVVTVLYRRMMGPGVVAGLAALMYAVDGTHAMPAAWLANRNALLSGVFGILAVIAHDHWRRRGRIAGAFWAMLCLAASLLSAEAGVGALAYLVAHAVCIDADKRSRRVAVILPYIAILIVWRVIWTLTDHGVGGVGFYIDPVSEPATFLASAVGRIPMLLLGQWAQLPPDVGVFLQPRGLLIAELFSVAVVVGLIIVMLPLVRRDAMARFWALGMVLSLPPICATFPLARLLIFTGVGAMGLLALYFGQVFQFDGQSAPAPGGKRPKRIVALVLAGIHLGVAPMTLAMWTAYPMGDPKLTAQLLVRAPLDASVEQQDLIIVNAPSVGHAEYLPILRELNGQSVPRRTRVLAPALPSVTIRRPDERTLVVRPEKGYFAWRFDYLFRSERHPMPLGYKLKLTGVEVEVTGLLPDGRPAEATFRFAVPLEDPSLRWLQWKQGEFIPFTPPAVGQTVQLAPGQLKLR